MGVPWKVEILKNGTVNEEYTECGEDDPRVIENGMSVPVSGLTADFVKISH